MRGWWSRNRLALVLLPVALLTALVASSSRVHDYWWLLGQHDAQRADSHGVVRFDSEYDDGFLRYPITPTIRLEGVERVTSLEDPGNGPDAVPSDGAAEITLPAGGALWRVRLHFDVDPAIAMTLCHVAVIDTGGDTYESQFGDFRTTVSLPTQKCVPDDTPGPETALGSKAKPKLAEGQQPRPRSYDTEVYIVVRTDSRPHEVRVWWTNPDYAEFPVSGLSPDDADDADDAAAAVSSASR